MANEEVKGRGWAGRVVTLRYTRESEEADRGPGMELGVEASPRGSRSGRHVVVRAVDPDGPASHAQAVTVASLRSQGEAEDDPETGQQQQHNQQPQTFCEVEEHREAQEDGFRVGDRIVRIDDHVLDDLEDDDCLAVLRDLPEDCLVVVERPETTRTQAVASTLPPTHNGRKSYDQSLPVSDSSVSFSPPAVGRDSASSGSAAPSGQLPRPVTSGKVPFLPRPPARKVKRAQSTAAHLAEKGLPGFQVGRVTLRRQEGQSLGLSIVPSFGATKFYYQVKRLLPGSVCWQCPSLKVGDRLLECNGRSLQNLTQSQCLEVLKNAGPRVSLTLLHELSDAEEEKQDHHERAERRVHDPEVAGRGDFVTAVGNEASQQKDGSREPLGEDQDHEPKQGASVKRTFAELLSGEVGEDGSQSKVKHIEANPAMAGNPFLDDLPDGRVADVDADGVTRSQDLISKSNPFYDDIFYDGVQQEKTLLDIGPGLCSADDPSSDNGIIAAEEDILLDLETDVRGVPGEVRTESTSAEMQHFQAGCVDLLGMLNESEDLKVQPLLGIPPPEEFSDISETLVASQQGQAGHAPVTNIDDLLGLDFGTSGDVSDIGRDLPVVDNRVAAEVDGWLDQSTEVVDLLPQDVQGSEQPEEINSFEGRVGEEEPPQPPSDPPPSIPSCPPPRLPDDNMDLIGEAESLQESDAQTSVFLPLDNVTTVSVSKQNRHLLTTDSTVHMSNITVTPSNSRIASVNVAKPKPTPRDQIVERSASPTGSCATVLTISGHSSLPTAAQIQFDNSTKETSVRSTVPADAFLPTSIAVSSSGVTQGEDGLIVPMSVHRDHLGNKLAAPSPPETLGRASLMDMGRTVDEGAKRDLQNILNQMDMSYSLRVKPDEKDSAQQPTAEEDDIVPVKLTNKQAEVAQQVLQAWSSEENKSKATASSSNIVKSGFQKAVGTVIDVKSGKIDKLPNNSVFLTTIGVTTTPSRSAKAGDLEEEITPMTAYTTHLGTRHYAPSPPETLSKRTGVRHLDSVAKQDIVALMADMAERSTAAIGHKDSGVAGQRVDEDRIVATVLTRDQQRLAMAAVQKWMSAEPKPPAKASLFQRLVGEVMDSAAIDNKKLTSKEVHEAAPAVSSTNSQNVVSKGEELVRVEAERPEAPQLSAAPVLRAKRPQLVERPMSMPSLAGDGHLHLQTSTDAEADANTVAAKPVPIQRGLRSTAATSPSNTSGLSLATPLGLKPLGKLGTHSVPGGRTGAGGTTTGTGAAVPNFLNPVKVGFSASTSLATRAEYGKTRTEDAPFLIEVLKGIVGVGIKVKVTLEGHVQITEVQKNSPVDKNGNVRVGDYLLCVNTTELTGQSEGRVQQVIRLLPRGLVKLLVSSSPLPTLSTFSHGESGSLSSPRVGVAYSQYGVRLSALPFPSARSDGSKVASPTSPTSPTPSHSSRAVVEKPEKRAAAASVGSLPPLPVSPATATAAPKSAGSVSVTEPLSVSAGQEESLVAKEEAGDEEGEGEDDDEMSTRRLSKALCPRVSTDELPPAAGLSKPAPRPRASTVPAVPFSESQAALPHQDAALSESDRPMTASEIVASASKRPSARHDDLSPLTFAGIPQSVSAQDNDLASHSSRHPGSVVDPVIAGSMSPSGLASPRDELLPVFAEAARKTSPVPAPRPKSRLSSAASDSKLDEINGNLSPRSLQSFDVEELPVAAEADHRLREEIEESVHTSIITVKQTAQAPVSTPPFKVPPPVAPKPKRTSSVSSDVHSEYSKEVSSLTLSSPKLKNFPDAEITTSDKKVSSAARMFEQKASDSAATKTAPHASRPKPAVSVSSVVKSFNQPEPEPVALRSGSKNITLGFSASGEGHIKPINSALMPVSERRKSMPTPISSSSSLSLTRPSTLSQARNQPTSANENEQDSSFNSALKPRRGLSNTTSLKSLIAAREHKDVEAEPTVLPPSVGKGSHPEVRLRPRSYLHDTYDPVSARSKHASWSADMVAPAGESDPRHRSPKMIFTSTLLHHSEPSAANDKHLESTLKRFDDLLSDKHRYDSDDEIPKVSNSVSLDRLLSKTADKADGSSMKSSDLTVVETLASEEVFKAQEALQAGSSPGVVKAERFDVSTKDEDDHKGDDVAAVTCQVHLLEKIADDMPELSNLTDQADISEPSEKTGYGILQPKESKALAEIKTEVEAAEDAYPFEDAPSSLDLDKVVGQAAPEEKDTAKTAHLPDSGDTLLYQEQASSIVHLVIGNALQEIASTVSASATSTTLAMAFPEPASLSCAEVKKDRDDWILKEDEGDDESDGSCPALPDEGPPPLPGAPPPPLIFTKTAERLVAKEDLEGLVPTQDDKADSKDIFREVPTGAVRATVTGQEIQVETDEATEAKFSAMHPSPPKVEEGPIYLTTDPGLLSMEAGDTSQADNADVHSLLLGSGLISEQKDEEDEDKHHAVCETLSQDSGVQDEEMSEDGLRSSLEDSPTSHVDSLSVFDMAVTPDDVPRSVFKDGEGLNHASQSADQSALLLTVAQPEHDQQNNHSTASPSPRPSPRSRISPSLPPSLAAPTSPPPVPSMLAHPQAVNTSTLDHNADIDDSNDFDRVPQGSVSPRCSFETEQEQTAFPGGVSTIGNGDIGREARKEEGALTSDSVVQTVNDGYYKHSAAVSGNVSGLPESSSHNSYSSPCLPSPVVTPAVTPRKKAMSSARGDSCTAAQLIEVPTEASTEKVPTSPVAQIPEEDDLNATAQVTSSRKWCILDQSGSIFLNGPSDGSTAIQRSVLRQVSTLQPAELAQLLQEANKDLDAANLPKALELRVVAVRGLSGRPVKVEVTQREDYYVQVTRVHSKDSALHEADILLSLDGRSLKHRRPAQVQAQIESASVKGVLLTARGLRLPPSVLRQLEEQSGEAKGENLEVEEEPTPLVPAPALQLPAVEVGPGEYEIVMTKGATGVGFCLEGGRASPMGDLPIVIKRIFKGGPAEKCGQLRVKDEIQAVNGVDFTVMRHYEAWNHLKFLEDGPVRIHIRRPQP